MEKIKVLLVDDHIIIRDGIRFMLRKEPDISVVAEANNGVEAIDYLENNTNNVDVVLLDINMPELNGIDAAEIITKRFKNIKILALTMHAEESYIISMLKAGSLGYILKESSKEDLVVAIKTIALGNKYYSNEVSVTMINSLMKEDKPKKIEISKREEEVLKLIVDGLTNVEIATELNISNRTVETHRRNILHKLDVRNTAELVRYAIEHDLIGKDN